MYTRIPPFIDRSNVKISEHPPDKCRNCDADAAFGQIYCGICGQKYATERLTLHEIGHDMLHALVHVDRSAFSLVRMLLVHPGTVARDYVQGKRKRYFGPFSFLVIVVAGASALVALTGFRAVYANRASAVADFLQAHLNLLLFVEVPLLAAFSRLFDGRGGFNFAEHLVLAAYTSSMRVLFATLVVMPFWFVFPPPNPVIVALVSAGIWALYFGFAESQFLPGGRGLSWGKGFLAAILSDASMQGVVSLVAAAVPST
jgi:hypothetical protein